MASALQVLRLLRSRPYTRAEQLISDRLYDQYCNRPQHRNRLTQRLRAALRAAANRVARYGNPPGYNARLAYRMHKKRRAKQLAIAIYGDPSEPTTRDLLIAAGEVPGNLIEPPLPKLAARSRSGPLAGKQK